MYKILLIFILFTSIYSCKNCETKIVSYLDREPYDTTITEYEELDYHISDNKLHYGRVDGAILLGENPQLQISCSVINDGPSGGEFVLYAILTCQGDKVEIRETKYIPAKEAGEFDVYKEVNPFTFKTNIEVEDWGIISPTVPVEKVVTRYRDVIRYRECNTCEENCE